MLFLVAILWRISVLINFYMSYFVVYFGTLLRITEKSDCVVFISSIL